MFICISLHVYKMYFPSELNWMFPLFLSHTLNSILFSTNALSSWKSIQSPSSYSFPQNLNKQLQSQQPNQINTFSHHWSFSFSQIYANSHLLTLTLSFSSKLSFYFCFLAFITLYCSFCKERKPALIPSLMHDWTWSDWLLEANKFFPQPFPSHTQTLIHSAYMYEVVIFHYRISQNYEAHPIAEWMRVGK